jgi:cold shock CspA family protein
MKAGLIKWFDNDKGFGLVGTPNNEDYFLHAKSFSIKPESLKRGTVVIFSEAAENSKITSKKNNAAKDSRLLESNKDWYEVMNYFEKDNIINIEVTITGESRHGNRYKRKEIKRYSLVKFAARQFFETKTPEEISDILIEYKIDKLDGILFIQYCEFIEQSICKYIPEEKKEDFLSNLFESFGNNIKDEVLFCVWRDSKFKYIGKPELSDYEIPRHVLEPHISSLSLGSLEKIKNYSYGDNFCSVLIEKDINDAKSKNINEIKNIYQRINLIQDFDNKKKLKTEVDYILSSAIIREVEEQSKSLNYIDSHSSLTSYQRLKYLIPQELEEKNRKEIEDRINAVIRNNATNEFHVELWLLNLLDTVSFEQISIKFLSEDTNISGKVLILKKVKFIQQCELINKYQVQKNWIEASNIIFDYVKSVNNLSHSLDIKDELFNRVFWENKKGNELLNYMKFHIESNSNSQDLLSLFFENLTQKFPEKLIRDSITNLNKTQCENIFNNQQCTQNFALEILMSMINPNENIYYFYWLYSSAKTKLNNELFQKFDFQIFEEISNENYFKLWLDGSAKKIPKSHIKILLNDNYDDYEQIKLWIEKGIVEKGFIINFLLSNVKEVTLVSDRIIFYQLLNHIKFILELDDKYLENIKNLNDDFINIILWYLEVSEKFNFELLKQKFIYFNPESQLFIIRRLFYLIERGELKIEIEELNEIRRVDVDLYRTNLKFNPNIPLDISTDVVLQALLNFKTKGEFILMSDLISIALENLYEDNKRKFKFEHYFEECKGRTEAKFDWSRNGEIKKIRFGQNQFYFSIEFEYNPNLVEKVKQIPGRKWNPETKFWGVPAKYEKEILDFAKENRFYLDFEGSNYANNLHLVNYIRKEIPKGTIFCDGRLANNEHTTYKKAFWWCAGKECFENCETTHSKEDWKKYTLLDFIRILGFDIDEHKETPKAFIPKGKFYQFISLINRFSRLLEKMYCEECEDILFPVETSHIAAHTVVKFCCKNKSCSKHEKVVYLNHCMNGQCNSIIDSRVSKKCSNGLYICNNCGSCCSHNMLLRRKNNLEKTNSYIHPQLIQCVNNKLGHLERAEYFCYKCGNDMDEKSEDSFKCKTCDVEYDTSKYRFKRPHKHLRNAPPFFDDF